MGVGEAQLPNAAPRQHGDSTAVCVCVCVCACVCVWAIVKRCVIDARTEGPAGGCGFGGMVAELAETHVLCTCSLGLRRKAMEEPSRTVVLSI